MFRSVNLKVLATGVLLLVITALFLVVRRKSQATDISRPRPKQALLLKLQQQVGKYNYLKAIAGANVNI